MKIINLGRMAVFYIPAAKWTNMDHTQRGKTIAILVHEFLIANYKGYTVKGPYIGRWRPTKKSPTTTDAVMEIKASFVGKDRIPKLHKFLIGMCKLMEEECMYLETGEDAYLIYP